MNLLGTLINAGNAGGGINNLATSLVAQALSNKPLQIGGHNFGGPAPMNTNNMGGGPSRGGFMDRRGGDDFRVRYHFNNKYVSVSSHHFYYLFKKKTIFFFSYTLFKYFPTYISIQYTTYIGFFSWKIKVNNVATEKKS